MSFSALPDTVTVAEKEYHIESDFRASISFEILANDPDKSEEEIALGMLDLYFPQYAGRFLTVTEDDEPELVFLAVHAGGAINQLLEFYRGGGANGKNRKSGGKRRLYDFALDEAYLYASFLQAYQIDLRTEALHWWNFKSLFSALPQDTIFGNILHIRSMKLNSKMSKEEKAYYQKLKRVYALPEKISERQQQEDDALAAVLMGSGDLAELEVNKN